jgi:hypothetical protein
MKRNVYRNRFLFIIRFSDCLLSKTYFNTSKTCKRSAVQFEKGGLSTIELHIVSTSRDHK